MTSTLYASIQTGQSKAQNHHAKRVDLIGIYPVPAGPKRRYLGGDDMKKGMPMPQDDMKKKEAPPQVPSPFLSSCIGPCSTSKVYRTSLVCMLLAGEQPCFVQGDKQNQPRRA